MTKSGLQNLWHQPLIRAAIIHVALLSSGWIVALMIARALGLSVSLLGILLGYALINIALTGWLLRRRAVPEPESDATAEALAEFADDPLGALIGDAKGRLAKARKRVGRQAAMYQPLDRLVRQTRKIERRLALEPELRVAVSRSLSEDLPLIATTAEQYVGLAGQELSSDQNARMIVAEGVLREAGDRLESLVKGEAKVDAPVVGLIRMDTNAEVLAERLSSDTDAATRRAAAARVSHALRQAGRSVDGDFAGELRRAAVEIDSRASAGDLPEQAADLIAAAERVVAEGSLDAEVDLRKRVQAHLSFFVS